MSSSSSSSSSSSYQDPSVEQEEEKGSWRIEKKVEEGSEEVVKQKETKILPLHDCSAHAAIDVSGSTGCSNILEAEVLAANALLGKNRTSRVIPWDTRVFPTTTVQGAVSLRANGGTEPSSIFNDKEAKDLVVSSDCWILMTDGEVGQSSVTALANNASNNNILDIPVIIVLVGAPSKTSSPSSQNISVGIALFASCQHGLFLYLNSQDIKDTHWKGSLQKTIESGDLGGVEFKILQSSGIFSSLGTVEVLDSSTRWSDLPTVTGRVLECFPIPIVSPEERKSVPTSLIQISERVAVDLKRLLLPSTFLSFQELQEVFGNAEVAQKIFLQLRIRGETKALREFLLKHQQDPGRYLDQDFSGAGEIVALISQARRTSRPREEIEALVGRLQEAYKTNDLRNFEERKSWTSNPVFLERRNCKKFIDQLLGQLQQVEASNYSADVLSRQSNRAMRAEKVSDVEAIDQLDSLEGSLSSLPSFDPTLAFTAECPICCAPNSVLALTFLQVDEAEVEKNTNDFSLNFPLACGSLAHNASTLSSQISCLSCSKYLLKAKRETTLREKAAITLPLCGLSSNFQVWTNCLAVGLANGIKTPNLLQLFISILDHYLCNKGWLVKDSEGENEKEIDCSFSSSEEEIDSLDPEYESKIRKRAVEWAFDMLFHQVKTNDTFQVGGNLVEYPKAIEFIVKEAQAVENLTTAFLLRYPLRGFSFIIRSLRKFRLARPLDEGLVLYHRKLILWTVERYMRTVLNNQGDDTRSKILEALYQINPETNLPIEFSGRISTTFSPSLLSTLFPDQVPLRDLNKHFGLEPEAIPFPSAFLLFLRRLIDIRLHDSIANTITKLKAADPFIQQVLESPETVSETQLLKTLNEMFVSFEKTPFSDVHRRGLGVPPFVSPYGPSILFCAYCLHPFVPSPFEGTIEEISEVIKKNRADHFNKAFLVPGGSTTGMPPSNKVVQGKTSVPSLHINLHRSVVDSFAALDEEKRSALLALVPVDPFLPSKEIDDFASLIVQKIIDSKKGNLYEDRIHRSALLAIPSFLQAVRSFGFTLNENSFTFANKLSYELQIAFPENKDYKDLPPLSRISIPSSFFSLVRPIVPTLTLQDESLIQQSLYKAVEEDQVDQVTKILCEGGKVENTGPDGLSLLATASRRGNLQMIRRLISHGADVKANKESAVFEAARNGHVEAVSVLVVFGADPNALDSEGNHLLVVAHSQGHAAVVKKLIDLGANSLVLSP